MVHKATVAPSFRGCGEVAKSQKKYFFRLKTYNFRPLHVHQEIQRSVFFASLSNRHTPVIVTSEVWVEMSWSQQSMIA